MLNSSYARVPHRCCTDLVSSVGQNESGHQIGAHCINTLRNQSTDGKTANDRPFYRKLVEQVDEVGRKEFDCVGGGSDI
ncbi:hypothetical protein D3C80_1623200 [compost metagenome]